MIRFLWVTFQIDDICKANNDNAIRQVLKTLPRGLNETYARILRKITDQYQPVEAVKIFKWLSASKYPLTLSEIREAVSIELGDSYFGQIENRLSNDGLSLIQNCGNLVIINNQDQTIQFAHSTVLEFLRSSWIEINYPNYYINVFKTDLELGEQCLTYLSLADFETQIATINPAPRPEARTLLDAQTMDWASAISDPGSMLGRLARFTLIRQLLPNRTRVPQPSGLFKRREASASLEPLEVMGQKFKLLKYICMNWLYHCANVSAQDKQVWMVFEDLLYKKTFLFQHLPWMDDGTFPEPLPALPLFQWAIENGQVALLYSVMCQLGRKHLDQYFNYPFNYAIKLYI